MKKLIQSFDWVVELLLTAVVIVTVTAGLMQVTAGAVYASESTAEEVPDREYLKAENLPADTDYVLVMDKSGSVWSQVYNGEAGVFEKIRNSAAQAFLRVAAGTNNRIAVVYFDKSADSEKNGCLPTDINSEDGFYSLMETLNYTVPSGTAKTEENASTNIAAGLERACDILDTAGSSERKKCIILFSDGFNDLYVNSNSKKVEFRKKAKDEIFGTLIEGTSGERRDDGLTARIRDSKYELYCIYLENPEAKDQLAESRRLLEKLVKVCKTDSEAGDVKKFYYVSGDLDEKTKYFDLAKLFSEVFYVSQNNSRHQELPMVSDADAQRSQIYVPNAAVSQLNMFLVNVPKSSEPVLRNTDTGETYSFGRDANEPEMVYYNIKHPQYGNYELVIPGATDARGAYAYYTDLRAAVDIEKTNGFGYLPIGRHSKVKTRCSFYDSEGNPYEFADNEHFKLNMYLSQDGSEPAELPMRWDGESWETAEDIKIDEMGAYTFTAKASLDNETLNTLEYTKQLNVTAMDYWVWIYGVLAVIALIVIWKLYVWLRRKILRDKIAKEKEEIEAEKLAVEERYKGINSETFTHQDSITKYEGGFDKASWFFTEYKEAKALLRLSDPGTFKLLDEYKDYGTLYKNAEKEYVELYNAATNKAAESSNIDSSKTDGISTLKHKESQVQSCLQEIRKFKQEAENKASVLEMIAEEANGNGELLYGAIDKMKDKMNRDINCGIEINWPSQSQRYYVDMEAEEFDYGIVAFDDLEAIPLKKGLVTTSFKEAIGNYETNIVILPYQTENGAEGIELQSDKDFGIADMYSNMAVKSCEPIDPKQPDSGKKYVAKLEQGGRYRLNFHTDDGLGALTLILK